MADESSTSTVAADAASAALIENLRPPGWRNPEPKGPYDLLILGAGPAGLLAARGAATLGKKVALIERKLLGGNRLNFGCVPSKALIRMARLYARMRDAQDAGVPRPAGIRVDFAQAMQRIRQLQERLSRAESVQRLRDHGVDVYFGAARFAGPAKVSVAGSVLRFKKRLLRPARGR